jgi:hypothetical protein
MDPAPSVLPPTGAEYPTGHQQQQQLQQQQQQQQQAGSRLKKTCVYRNYIGILDTYHNYQAIKRAQG